MSEVIKLVDKVENSALWSPIDCVRDFLSELESGKIDPDCIAIHYNQKLPDGGLKPCNFTSNLTYGAHITLLTIALRKIVDEMVD